MKKFLIILLVLFAAFFIYAVLDTVLLSFSGDYLKFNNSTYEEIDLSNLENSSREDYYYYLKEHNMVYPKNHNVVLDIANIEDGSDFRTLNNYEGKNISVLTEETGEITWKVLVPEAGYYNIQVEYYPYEGKSSAIERTVKINEEVPFVGATNIVFPRTWGGESAIKQDIHGNDIRPTQIEKPQWITKKLNDPVGYITDPYAFYFNEGDNLLTFVSEREPLLIGGIEINSVNEIKTYDEVEKTYESNGYKKVEKGSILIEGESNKYTTSPTLYPGSDKDPATSFNNNPKLIKLNTIGGENWGITGDYIVWNFEVEETGLYDISLRVKQRLATGMASGRRIYINDEVLFKELENYSFAYSNGWRIQTLGNDERPFNFYFEKGQKYEIKIETTLGQYGSRIAHVESSINNLSKLYREIIKFTGPEPDVNRDYMLEDRIPNLKQILQDELDNLKKVRQDLIDISGSKSEKTGIIDTIVFQLEDFIKKPTEIHKKIKAYNSNVSSLGTLVILLSSQPLEIDYLIIHAQDEKLPKVRKNVFQSTIFSIRAFFATFFTDYSSVGMTNNDPNAEKIEVWLSVGKDQSNILRKLIDEQFTPQDGIQVDLKLVSGSALLPATLAGRGPDVAMGVGSNVPVNYALRNAVVDLTKFSDFEEVSNRFHDSSLVPFSFNNGTFALPEQQMFLMMFYRKDIFEEYNLTVPQTWDELIQSVIDLQKYNLEFYLPVPMTEGAAVNLPPNPIFSTMFYQNDGEFYINGDTESGFDSGMGPAIFERWTEFYTDYSFPVQADFANRFRSGQMPIGISYYNTYNTLSVFAPEIRGKWEFVPVPGTIAIDENGDEYIRRDTVSTGTGAMILAKPDKEEASWKFLKWWTSTETQIRFGREMEGILGAAARYPTANVEAMKSLPWRMNELNVLQEQWKWVKGIPEVPGSYMTGRHLDNALRLVLNDNANPRETIYDYVQQINDEIRKKRDEFGLD